ncbi:MAG: PAS domain-containing protein [Chloroflexi bacterium]|nr:PAS domain-containing protein [Chloroflexota bacterium]
MPGQRDRETEDRGDRLPPDRPERVATQDYPAIRLRRLILVMTGAIFVVEFGIMLGLHSFLFNLADPLGALLDGGILIVVMYPVLYLAVYRPFRSEMAERRQAESERKRAEEEMERLLAEVRQANQRLTEAGMRRQELTQEAAKRAAELDATNASIADGLVTYDPQGNILHMNPAAVRMLGERQTQPHLPLSERVVLLKAETPQGKPIRVEDLPPLRALRGETVQGQVLVIHPPGKKDLWLSVSAAPICTPEGGCWGRC